MKKILSFMAVATFATCLFAPQAQARPQYLKGLEEHYSTNKTLGEKKCGVCHGKEGKDKKVVNDYGKALAEALKPMKNEKDAAKLKAGIEKAGEQKQGEKTYDEILKAGELPEVAK